MPRRASTPATDTTVQVYRHDATRKNNPPAGLAASGQLRPSPKLTYSYDPHLPPVLRSDPTGKSDDVFALLEVARTRALTAEEAQRLAEALRVREPWLEWAGKREKQAFVVDPVALHIHERISSQAILRVAARENIQRSLFADPEQTYREAVQFYQHDVDWANRMILGDSLQVMASLAQREDLAGKVQMIYLDPPYGIKFASNFQPEVGKRDVRDRDSDLTREPEMVKAYRDTWTLGIHSYLAYLRDRLVLCREMLAEAGSIFVQISDENLHRVRSVLDEVFGGEHFVAVIAFTKTGGASSALLPPVVDFLLWYAKDKTQVKYRQLYLPKEAGEEGASGYTLVESADSMTWRPMTTAERNDPKQIPSDWRIFDGTPLMSTGATKSGSTLFPFQEKEYVPPRNSHWKTTTTGLQRLAKTGRIIAIGNRIEYKRYLDDFPVYPMTNTWLGMGERGFVGEKYYVVQTDRNVIQRCILMTTDPGDLVLDPTCGGGTTAFVAEQWGRRWITIDTSRVALALARQRLLTASFQFYKVKDGDDMNPSHGFVYRTVPHITLKSIAQNPALDSITDRHQHNLDRGLIALNDALRTVKPTTRQQLATKLAVAEGQHGRRMVAEADRRRWLLPKDGWREWEVPYEADPDWPPALQAALRNYQDSWRAKMVEVNKVISASAEQEELVDQPEVMRGVVRVSGPFTMEAVMPAEASLDDDSPIADAPNELDTFGQDGDQSGGLPGAVDAAANADAYLDTMLRLLRADGVRFPNNTTVTFTRLEPIADDFLHAEGEWQAADGQTRLVAVSFGPEYGPVTAFQVEEVLPRASRRGYDDLVFAGFSFDGAAQAIVQDDPHPRLRCHLAHIRPDVNMGGLLKETPNSQLFTVFGSPRTELTQLPDDQFAVEMQGVDIYNPVENTLLPTSADKVAAWFVDSDYDGYTFCITQAFFPDRKAWEKLAKALKGVVDEERFAAFGGTTSLPFPKGQHGRVAVKVIDPRGNEVMRVHRLPGGRGR